MKAAPKKQPDKSRSDVRRLHEIVAVLTRHGALRGMTPEKLRRIAEDLGPTFVKMGQILSMRSDMLPAAYCQELARLRADAAPMPFGEVRTVIEEEYGARPETVFASIDETPLGAASMAQAHLARLADGTRVVVKVQRQGIHDTMAQDIRLLRRVVRLLQLSGETGGVLDFDAMLRELWAAAQQEMDFLLEARHADEFRACNRDVLTVACPRIYHEHTTARVLVMEYVGGLGLDDAGALRRAGYDPDALAAALADNYIKQIIEDGFFHADPHTGNLRVRGGKIVWLDFGMMGRLSPRDRQLCRRAVYAMARGDAGTLRDVVLTLGVHDGRVDHARLYGDIDDLLARYGRMGMGEMDLARLLEEFLTVAGDNGIAMPPGVTMLGRGLLTLQGVLVSLSPSLNILEIVKTRLEKQLLRDFDPEEALRSGAQAFLASGRRAIDLPSQLADLLGMALKGQNRVGVELTGSAEPLAAVSRMVSRLITALLAAALIVGASLVCMAELPPCALGIPLLAAAGYALALVLCAALLIGGLRRRRKEKKRKRPPAA